MASDNKMRERLKSRDWTSDPAVCDIAIEAAHTVLESFRPSGAIPWKDAGLGVLAANTFIKEQKPEQMREVPRDELSVRLQKIVARLDRPMEDQAPFERGVVSTFRRRA
jgi:hypothetical protein